MPKSVVATRIEIASDSHLYKPSCEQLERRCGTSCKTAVLEAHLKRHTETRILFQPVRSQQSIQRLVDRGRPQKELPCTQPSDVGP